MVMMSLGIKTPGKSRKLRDSNWCVVCGNPVPFHVTVCKKCWRTGRA